VRMMTPLIEDPHVPIRMPAGGGKREVDGHVVVVARMNHQYGGRHGSDLCIETTRMDPKPQQVRECTDRPARFLTGRAPLLKRSRECQTVGEIVPHGLDEAAAISSRGKEAIREDDACKWARVQAQYP
jgi:hypothetical protein